MNFLTLSALPNASMSSAFIPLFSKLFFITCLFILSGHLPCHFLFHMNLYMVLLTLILVISQVTKVLELEASTYSWLEIASTSSNRRMLNIFRVLITCWVTPPSLLLENIKNLKNKIFYRNWFHTPLVDIVDSFKIHFLLGQCLMISASENKSLS